MNWFAIACGGALGALARAFIYKIFYLTEKNGLYILPTFVVNIIGSLLIGVVFCLLIHHTTLSLFWRNFVVTGFLGALTTFSTYSLDTFRLFQSGFIAHSLVYSVGSMVSCVFLTWAGYTLTTRLLS